MQVTFLSSLPCLKTQGLAVAVGVVVAKMENPRRHSLSGSHLHRQLRAESRPFVCFLRFRQVLKGLILVNILATSLAYCVSSWMLEPVASSFP